MTDQELLRRFIAAGDEAAFRELVRRHGAMVRAAAVRLAGDEVDDVTQATFLLLSRKAASLTKHRSLAGWLYNAARFCARNARRSRRRREEHLRRAQEAAMGETVHEQAAHAELRELLDAGLAKLPEAHRQALLVRYLEGLSLEQASEQLGLTPAAVAKRCERGLDRLREYFVARGETALPAAISAVLESQIHPLSGSQTSQLTRISSGSAPASVASLASSTALGMAMAELKIVALVVFGIGGIAAAMVAVAPVLKAPKTAPVPIAATVPATAPALTADGAKTFAAQFLSALRDRDGNRLAEMVAGASPAERALTAGRYITQFRDGPYSRFPARLNNVIGNSVTQAQSGQVLSATIDAAPPTVADIQRLSIRMVAINGRWVVQNATYTSAEAISSDARIVTAASAPAASNVPPATYAEALRVYRDLLSHMDIKVEEGISETRKPMVLESLTSVQDDLRKLAEALKTTDLAIEQPVVERLVAMTARLRAALEQNGAEGFKAEGKRMEASEREKFNRIYALGDALTARADAEADAVRTVARPPAVAPAVEVVTGWDGAKHHVRGPLVVPAWLRASETFRMWQERHNVQTFRTTDDDGNRYEVYCMGAVEEDGATHELIPSICQYRADGTLAATTQLDSRGRATEWSTLDATGTRYTMSAIATNHGSDVVLRYVRFFNADGGYREWSIEARGVVRQEQQNNAVGEFVAITHQAAKTASTTRASVGRSRRAK
jgi:RNA polymerase sigma factor (sigma-70 family)